MVDPIRTRPVSRDKLASFLKNQELIKAFENLVQDVGVAIPATIEALPADASNVLTGQSFGPHGPQHHQPAQLDAASLLGAQSFAPKVPQFNQLARSSAASLLEAQSFMPRPLQPVVPSAAGALMEALSFVPRGPQHNQAQDDAAAGRILAAQIFGG